MNTLFNETRFNFPQDKFEMSSNLGLSFKNENLQRAYDKLFYDFAKPAIYFYNIWSIVAIINLVILTAIYPYTEQKKGDIFDGILLKIAFALFVIAILLLIAFFKQFSIKNFVRKKFNFKINVKKWLLYASEFNFSLIEVVTLFTTQETLFFRRNLLAIGGFAICYLTFRYVVFCYFPLEFKIVSFTKLTNTLIALALFLYKSEIRLSKDLGYKDLAILVLTLNAFELIRIYFQERNSKRLFIEEMEISQKNIIANSTLNGINCGVVILRNKNEICYANNFADSYLNTYYNYFDNSTSLTEREKERDRERQGNKNNKDIEMNLNLNSGLNSGIELNSGQNNYPLVRENSDMESVENNFENKGTIILETNAALNTNSQEKPIKEAKIINSNNKFYGSLMTSYTKDNIKKKPKGKIDCYFLNEQIYNDLIEIMVPEKILIKLMLQEYEEINDYFSVSKFIGILQPRNSENSFLEMWVKLIYNPILELYAVEMFFYDTSKSEQIKLQEKKLQLKSDLISKASQDLKNPLISIGELTDQITNSLTLVISKKTNLFEYGKVSMNKIIPEADLEIYNDTFTRKNINRLISSKEMLPIIYQKDPRSNSAKSINDSKFLNKVAFQNDERRIKDDLNQSSSNSSSNLNQKETEMSSGDNQILTLIFPLLEKLSTAKALTIFADNIISDLEFLSKSDDGKMIRLSISKFNIKNDIEMITEFSNGLIRKNEFNVKFKTNININVPPFIETDPFILKQILVNIISNSIKLTFSGEIRLTVSKTEGKLEIQILDTGIGYASTISANRKSELSEIEKNWFVVSNLVILLGGTFKLEPNKPKGSKFIVRIPISRNDKETEKQVYLTNFNAKRDILIERLFSNESVSPTETDTLNSMENKNNNILIVDQKKNKEVEKDKTEKTEKPEKSKVKFASKTNIIQDLSSSSRDNQDESQEETKTLNKDQEENKKTDKIRKNKEIKKNVKNIFKSLASSISNRSEKEGLNETYSYSKRNSSLNKDEKEKEKENKNKKSKKADVKNLRNDRNQAINNRSIDKNDKVDTSKKNIQLKEREYNFTNKTLQSIISNTPQDKIKNSEDIIVDSKIKSKIIPEEDNGDMIDFSENDISKRISGDVIKDSEKSEKIKKTETKESLSPIKTTENDIDINYNQNQNVNFSVRDFEKISNQIKYKVIFNGKICSLKRRIINFNLDKNVDYNTDAVGFTRVNILVAEEEVLVKENIIKCLEKYFAFLNLPIQLNIIEARDGIESLYCIYWAISKEITLDYIFTEDFMRFIDGSHFVKIVDDLINNGKFANLKIYVSSAYNKQLASKRYNYSCVKGFLS